MRSVRGPNAVAVRKNRLTTQCAQWNASRVAAWRHQRVAIARPVRIAFCTNLRFYLTFRKRSEIGQVPELSTLNWSDDQNGVCVFCLKTVRRALRAGVVYSGMTLG